MTAFAYIAKHPDGQTIQASLDAASRADALTTLKSDGLTILSLNAGNDTGITLPATESRPRRLRRSWRAGGPIPLALQTVFCRQLAISVKAGLPLRDALESIEQDEDNVVLSRHLKRVILHLYDGVPFSDALERQGRAFGKLFVALIRSAEESGSLGETLEKLAEYLERADQLQSKMRSLIAYPLFVVGFFILVVTVMTLGVLPRFQSIFAGFSAELPAITRIVFGINHWIITHLLWLGVGAGAAGGLLYLFVKSRGGRRVFDRYALRIPVFGPCWQKISVARFSRTLAILSRGGVSIASAIEIAAGVSSNRAIESALMRTAERIVNGAEIAIGLQAEKDFPQLFIRMVGVGERSGQLPDVLNSVAGTYEKQVEATILVTMALAEPFFIAFFGVLILAMILAIYVPIFTVSSHV